MFGPLVAAYLFCGGTAGGACFVLAVMSFMVPKGELCTGVAGVGGARPREAFNPSPAYRKLFGPAHAVALLVLIIGILCLIADAGTPSAAFLLVVSPTFTYLSVGSFVLGIGMLLVLFLAYAWTLSRMGVPYRLVRVIEALMAVAGLAIAVYTGLLLASMPAVPIWATPWLPALFVASSLSCGCAMVMGCSLFSGASRLFGSVAVRMAIVDVVVIAIEAVLAFGFVATALSNPYEVAVQGGRALTVGDLHELFIFGFGVVGLALPAALDSIMALRRRCAPPVMVATATAVLVGGFIMRYCIVAVGTHPEVWAVVG